MGYHISLAILLSYQIYQSQHFIKSKVINELLLFVI